MEESIRQIESQLPKRLAPLEALNTSDIADLTMRFVASRMTNKKACEVAKKIVNERKKKFFSSLKDVIERKAGLTATTMINFVDSACKN